MDQNRTEPKSEKNSRRKFIQKAGAGLVLSSFPVRSVWANGGGLTGSIVASGTGSKYGEESPIALLSKGYYMTHANNMNANAIFNEPYQTYFGEKPPGYTGSGNPTIFEVLVGTNVKLGLNNLNHQSVKSTGSDPSAVTFSSDCFQMVTMLLNAYYAIADASLGIYYPIVGTEHSSQFTSVTLYGHNLSGMYFSGIGSDIANLIRDNHVGWTPYSE